VRISLILFLSAVVLLGAGCADFKSYMRDRGNDLADCFTVRGGIEFGIGARAQVTNYLSASIGGASEKVEVGYFGRAPVRAEWGGWLGFPFAQLAGMQFGMALAIDGWVDVPPNTTGGLLLALTSLFCTDARGCDDRSLPQGLCAVGVNVAELGPVGWIGFGCMEQRMEPPTPFLREKFFIEVGACVGFVGFDVGFNPVEFVDFLLGWTTLDMAGDDTWKKAPPGTESPEQPAP
jgi:hypothetical protein